MRRIAVILAVVILAVAVAASGTPVAQPLGGSHKTTPDDLPIVKLLGDITGGPSTPAGNPHGEPPGKDKKPPPKEPAANKWAVVIGIADYQGNAYDLWHPDEDAKEMAKALTENYGFSKGNIKLLVNRKATASAIVKAIDWLLENEDVESSVVFFFSGHGFRVADGEGWDADSELDGYDEGIVSHDFYGLPDGLLKEKLSALESQKVALGFGSCHSGGMFDDLSDLQASGRVIASACAADQLAWDYLLIGNTLWGKYFVDEGLLQGLADLDSDGASIEEAHSYAYPKVTAEQHESQPQMSDDFDGHLIP